MSIVYRAYDPDRLEEVALKMLLDTYVENLTVAARFAQEVELIQALRHPHLVNVYETGSVDGRQYMALKLIDGGNLAHILDAVPRIQLGRTALILAHLGSVLDYIHQQNIVHRDIKLGNILIDKAGNTYLIDFGIARWERSAHVVETDVLMPGTARYMPPEQVVSGLQFDHRADVYALGVVAYLLATGYFPFTGYSDRVLMNRHLTTTPSLPSTINPALPAALDPVLYQALSKRVTARYDTAGAFARAFREAVRGCEDITVALHMNEENPGHLLPEHEQLRCDVLYNTPPERDFASRELSEIYLSETEAETFRLFASTNR